VECFYISTTDAEVPGDWGSGVFIVEEVAGVLDKAQDVIDVKTCGLGIVFIHC
jgi:hypothetical protein